MMSLLAPLFLLLAGSSPVSAQNDPAPTEAAVAERPGGVHELLFARPFRLDEPYRHTWRAEQPLVSAGYLVVLRVDEDLARPRQTAEPVLFAGAQTLERVNTGRGSGRLVVVLPSTWDAQHGFAVDLAKTAFWFGEPELPERIDAARASEEAQRAHARGVRPFDAEAVKKALARGGEVLRIRDAGELRRAAARRILEFAPAEEELAQSILVPLVRPR